MYRFVSYIDPVIFFKARQTRQTDRHTDIQTDKTDKQTRQADKTGRQDRWTDGWIRQTDRQQLRGLVGHGLFKDILILHTQSSVYEDIGKRSNFKA